MICKHFRFQLVGRVLLIAVNVYAFFFMYFQSELYVTTLLLGLLPVWQIWSLITYVQRTNRQLSRFFDSLQAADFADRLPVFHDDPDFQELCRTLNHTIATFAGIQAETEQQGRFYQSALQQVGVGLITLKPNGAVPFINRSARRMLHLPTLKHIRQLNAIDPDLAIHLTAIESGRRQWIHIANGTQRVQLAVFAQNIRLPREAGYKLLTLQDLQPEMEEKESDAWRDLIRVLSHEIMNSLTPISSLAATALNLLPFEAEGPDEKEGDLRAAMETIHRRSQGLMQFVRSYRRFASIPLPKRQMFAVAQLIERMQTLMHRHFIDRSIALECQVEPPSLQAYIDPNQIEQVLLNVLSNAMDAVAQQPAPRVRLSVAVDRGRITIQVSDNGRGMDEAVLANAFIPFFTTKDHGSGIGLSISRQIMRLHGGSVHLRSTVDQGTTVTLRF